MRPSAEIRKRSVGIESNGAVLEVADKFALVLVAFFSIGLHGLVLGNFPADELLLGAREFDHAVFYLLEFGFRKRLSAQVNIIIETALDCRPYAELYTRIQLLESLRHQVRG